MATYLAESDIGALVTMPDAIVALEAMLVARSNNEIVNRPRVRVPIVGGTYNLMAAGWVAQEVVGHKVYTATSAGAAFHISLYGTDGSGLRALLAGGTISGLRTGAMTAISARRFANRSDGPIALIGSGFQATAQTLALAETMPGSEIRVFSRSAERRVAFAARMADATDGRCRAVESIEAALDGATVAVTITNAADPVLRLEDIQPGLTIVAVGNNTWLRNEIDPAVVGRADLVVVDDLENARIECGELMRAAETGSFRWDAAVELHDVFGGKAAGRTTSEDVILVELQGIAAADLAVADLVYRRARERGLGLELPA